MTRFEGRVWKFGHNIPTDQIVATPLVVAPMETIRQHVLETLNPDFPSQVEPGDIVVAGEHFGQSSGRAIAVKAIRATGVSCVIADSFARTFFRNCFEVGFPGLECPGITAWVEDGDRLSVDIAEGVIERASDGRQGRVEPVHPLLRRMLERGGLIAMGAEFDTFEWNEEGDRTNARSGERNAR
jgi:3-isopropylmalate/(R)-2-methylmalate dehydratase small subunit